MPRFNIPNQTVTLDGGIVTDVSPAARPENASSYSQNFMLLPNNTLARRYGVDIEESQTAVPAGAPKAYTQGFVRHFWPNREPGEDSVAMLINGSLFSSSASADPSGIDLRALNLLTVAAPNSMTSEGSLLYIPNPYDDSFPNTPEMMAYDFQNPPVQRPSLYFRDIWGVDDGLGIEDRPATLDVYHAYNLLNQGWTPESIIQFFTDLAVYPSNSDVPYFGLNATGTYDANLLKQRPKISGAPKGKIFIPLLRAGVARDHQTSADMGTLGVPLFATTPEYNHHQKLSVRNCVSHSGRLFFSFSREVNISASGTKDLMPDMAKFLAFGQVADGGPTTKFFGTYSGEEHTPLSCHFVQSPTEEGFRQLETDGGLIPISGLGEILQMVSMYEGLYIFTVNGVWLLTSSRGVFNPTDYRLEKVSESGCTNYKSVVEAGSVVYYASNKGIEKISWRSDANRAVVEPVSFNKCNEFLLPRIPYIIDSVHDNSADTISWLTAEPGATETKQEEIVMQVKSENFYLNTFPNHINGLLDTSAPGAIAVGQIGYVPLSASIVPKLVTAGAAGIAPVELQDIQRARTTVKRVLYITENTVLTEMGLGLANDRDFHDYTRVLGGLVIKPALTGSEIDAPATITYQHQNSGEAFRRKQMGKFSILTYNTTQDPLVTPYIPSSCQLTYTWDYSVNSYYATGNGPYQMHKPRDGREVSTASINPRGHGAAFTFTLSSEALNDCQILGFNRSMKVGKKV